MKGRIGVYICSCGTNISDNLDFDELVSFSSGLDNVAYVKIHSLFCSEEGKAFLADDIAREAPERVVIAACTPKEHEKTFREVLQKSGLNPYLFQMVNIREQVAWSTSEKTAATEKAKAHIRAAVSRVTLNEPLEKREIDVNTDVIVIGAGPAGMESALLLAKAGRKVCLVEKNSFIGGRPARFEDVFPKMECASCMLEPAMDEILHDDQIEVLTCSEVREVVGFVGNFRAQIRKKATYVDKEKCIGCGACYDACPVRVRNEFDYNLSERKAIYVPYTGSLPNVPVIDENYCLRLKGESTICREALNLGLITKEEYEEYKAAECSLCKEACMFEAINYDDREETVFRDAGGIIVATGFELFDASALPQFGYGAIPEVYTSLEFERILSQTGPTAGRLLMKDSREPSAISIIHCVGSRDKNHCEYCSGICCLYALKFSRLVRKHLPSAEIYHVYSDWCVPGKDNQAFLDSVKAEENIHFVHTPLPMRADIIQDDKNINILCTDVAGKKREILSDMVVLCPAIIPASDSLKIAGILGISQGKDGFFAEGHTKLAPVSTNIEGIYIAGCAQGPKDIQASIAQGAAAAGQVLSRLVPGRKLELEAATAEIDPDACSGCMTCIGLCPYKAISFDQEKKVSVINAALCKGCGTCVAACPSGSIKGRHFTTEQIFAEIRGALK